MTTFIKLLFIFVVFFSLKGRTQLIKRIDTIENNSQTNIILDPNGGKIILNDETANRVPFLNATSGLQASSVSDTELSYLFGVTSAIQTQINSKLTDPMTTDGDIIIESTGAVRLGVGTAGQILTVNAGLPSWQDAPSVSPLTTNGDLYYYNTVDSRLPIGTTGKVLTVTAGLPSWETAPAASVNTAFQLGDCKMSLLSTTDFETLHGTGWKLMDGSSIAGSDLDTTYSITTTPDAVTNSAFFRQQGSSSGALRAYQADQFQGHRHSFSQNGSPASIYNLVSNAGSFGGITVGTTATGNTLGIHNPSNDTVNGTPRTGLETRSKNIAMNYYCKINN